MTTSQITIIGAGNMGASLLGGLLKNGYAADKIYVADPDKKKLDYLQQEYKVNTTINNIDAIKHAQVIVFAIKPQIFRVVVQAMAKEILAHKPLLLSIAAGIRTSSIEHWIGSSIPLVRAMPNTPALISCGATALFANPSVTNDQRNVAESILRAVGIAVWVENEQLMDAVTALSGSGPAYFFLMIEALQQAGEKLGLPKQVAKLLTLQTAYGAARMALESEDEVTQLRHKVTSPGGTTEQAIHTLEEHRIREMFFNALEAANKRSIELGKQVESEK